MRPLLPLLVLACLAACSAPPEQRLREGKAGRHYGGVFNANEIEEPRSLFPLDISQASAHRVAAQLYEGLVRLDQQDLTVRPALAASWTVNPAGTVYTFRLREGVRFHDDPCFPDGKGRPLTAQDVLHCFTALCVHQPGNRMFWLFQDRVLGANAHYGATVRGETPPGVKGLEAPDERTVRITLVTPWPNFLQALAHQGCWVYPKESISHYGKDAYRHAVGTGPFRLKRYSPGEALVMERNPAYWDADGYGNQLPFLDGVRYTFVKDKDREMAEFEKGRLSILYELPVGRIGSLADLGARFLVQTAPGLSVQFYGFNARRPPFNDPRVRRAFSLAVDRQLLVDSVLGGLALPALRGVVPPGLTGYPYDTVPALAYDPAAARELLAEAGYPGGAGLPTVFLQVNSDGFGYVRVAALVQSMLERNLGARVVSTVLPADQHFDRLERGLADFWRQGWIADHPDPENFLSLFFGPNAAADSTGRSYLNTVRYRDARYDSLFATARRTEDTAQRMRLMALAEKRLMEDAVVLPLYHGRSVRLLQTWVRDLPINGMEYRDLRAVWFDPALRPGR